ncbi:hypothetical protein PHET_05137 [Paragonimus heterotremus]|uniref:DUF7083 domain-containing protein n=1 Tax=Paragonimus heterotremus TaxID=100268 RepID=A0A8J4WH40_9TREM|nr:hypothetical protein PHET_05137 [Paragonimus heterotremus]
MSLSLEEVKKLLKQQHEQYEATQLKLIEFMAQKMTFQHSSAFTTMVSTAETLANSITEFNYQSGSGIKFEAWFRRCEDIFKEDAMAVGRACGASSSVAAVVVTDSEGSQLKPLVVAIEQSVEKLLI